MWRTMKYRRRMFIFRDWAKFVFLSGTILLIRGTNTFHHVSHEKILGLSSSVSIFSLNCTIKHSIIQLSMKSWCLFLLICRISRLDTRLNPVAWQSEERHRSGWWRRLDMKSNSRPGYSKWSREQYLKNVKLTSGECPVLFTTRWTCLVGSWV